MKIFLVDDDSFTLRLLTRQLETIGLTDVTTFGSARAPLALLAADAKAADLILLDLAMPDMDGMEVLQQLATLKFPGVVIFISGMDDGVLQMAAMLATGLNLRVAGALKKPITPEQLRAALDRIGLD